MSDECAYCGGRGAGCHPAGVRPDSPAPLSPKYSTDPRLNAALEADARKLEAMGGDPGITLDDAAPLSPIALDFEAAMKVADKSGYPRNEGYEAWHRPFYEALDAQLRALVARVAQEEREKYEEREKWEGRIKALETALRPFADLAASSEGFCSPQSVGELMWCNNHRAAYNEAEGECDVVKADKVLRGTP